jgi:hypothetical protein
MRIFLPTIILALSLFLTESTSAAKAASNSDFNVRVKLSDHVILPNNIVGKNDIITAKYGDALWEADIGIEDIAILSDEYKIHFSGVNIILPQKTILVGATIDNYKEDNIATYCTEKIINNVRDVLEFTKIEWYGRGFSGKERICFIDVNKDGKFDSIFKSGKNDSKRTDSTIQPIPYKKEHDFPISGAKVVIRAMGRWVFQPPYLAMEVYFGGIKQDLCELYMDIPSKKKLQRRVFCQETVRKSTYPSNIKFGDISIEILSFDEKDGIKVKMLESFYRTRVWFKRDIEIIYVYH